MGWRDLNPFELAARSRRARDAWADVDGGSPTKGEVVDTDPGGAGHKAWQEREVCALIAPERAVQAAVLAFLQTHPRVAWVERMNVGVAEHRNPDGTTRRVRFAFKGCSDVVGQLKGGRFLAVECKRSDGGRGLTDDQRDFLEMVNRWGGVAFEARSIDDCVKALG